MEVLVFESIKSGSLYAAQLIANEIVTNNSVQEKTVLGLATGSTPIQMYDELVGLHKKGVSFANVVSYNLDEYYPINNSSSQSYHSFMDEHLFKHVDMHPENRFIPNGEVEEGAISSYCEEYEQSISRNGGIDVQVLGLGLNGHIGFNEPGSSRDSRTRKVDLSEVTRTAAIKQFGKEELVPTTAISMGIKTILEAEQIIVMAWGEKKADMIKECVEGEVSEEVPGSFLQTHPNTKIILDASAASKLSTENISLVENKLSKT